MSLLNFTPYDSRADNLLQFLQFLFFYELTCRVNIFFVFNKTVNYVCIFHLSFNENDHFDTIIKG